jgi:hypothetical protein
MTALLAATLAWAALVVALGLLGGRLLRRADAREAASQAAGTAAEPIRVRLVRRGQALAGSGSRR